MHAGVGPEARLVDGEPDSEQAEGQSEDGEEQGDEVGVLSEPVEHVEVEPVWSAPGSIRTPD